MSTPRILSAGARESGTLCARCAKEINFGDATSICRDCGAVHHSACWDAAGGCQAYECSASSKAGSNGSASLLTITRDELAAAQPLPSRPASPFGDSAESSGAKPRPRWNRVAVAAFILSVVGIPLFGLVTGLFAMVVGLIALVGHPYGRKGLGLAIVAIVLGLFDVIGWSVGLYAY